MSRLTHRTAPGFSYFVTTKTWQNRSVFQVAENAEILIACMVRYRDMSFYLLHEFVIMPNHLHIILTPTSETSLEKAMQLIKGGSSHEIHARRKNKMQIWQSGFHEESIRDQHDYRRKVEYIHMNPVEAHLVENSREWIYGSAADRIATDRPPERLSFTSGAKALSHSALDMSKLKLRPPKQPNTEIPTPGPGQSQTQKTSSFRPASGDTK